MTTQPKDFELERLQDERVHLRIKLNLAQDGRIRGATRIERLQRSLEQMDRSIADLIRRAKVTPG